MNIIDIVIIFFALATTFSLIYWAIKLGIGPVPSSRKVAETVYKNLPDNVNGEVIELGCGWGTLLKRLKRKYPNSVVIGYERSPVPRWIASVLCRTPIRGSDFFDADLSGAGLLVCYLYPQAMNRIARELLSGAPPGCLIITHTFALPGLRPEKTWQSNDLYGTPVYLYHKPRSSSERFTACTFEYDQQSTRSTPDI